VAFKPIVQGARYPFMKRLPFLLLAMLFLSWIAPGQDADKQIAWSPERTLSWSDFRGAAPFGMLFDAQSFSGIGYTYTPVRVAEAVEIQWSVTAYFDPGASWVRKGGESTALLLHEQGHFDIAEMFCRELRQKLETVSLNLENVDYFMELFLTESLNNMRVYQNAYDRETAHGTDREKQAYWTEMIRKELEKRSEGNF
jgi:hypothetical protein